MSSSETVRELICISCPLGCHLTVTLPAGGEQAGPEASIPEDEIRVSGNRCPRGEIYGREELLRPRRVVTATVSPRAATVASPDSRNVDSRPPRIPVKSRDAVPRERIPSVLNRLYAMDFPLPVNCGDVIAEIDGVDFLVTRSIPAD